MKFVTALHLKSWAETITARADLPELVGDLIRASCPSLEHYRFPSRDASQTHGWDGVADVVDGNTFVPQGHSLWEFGAGADYKAKANHDFEKRTQQLTAEERSNTTFIFVTPRIWDTGLESWKRDRSGEGWREVRIYDANTLDLWLAEYPTVSIPLAKTLGIFPPTGVQTVQDFWDEYRLNVAPPLSEALLLTGREQKAKQLCDSLSSGYSGLDRLRADSASEAAAFIAAAIMCAGGELSRYLQSKTLFIDSPDAAKAMCATGGFALILLPEARRPGAAASLARTNQVILVLGNDDIAPDAESLKQMNTRDFAIGLTAMGLDEHESFQLAAMCGRSVTVLARLNASEKAIRPEWSERPELIPLMLAGGWDASNEHDCAVVSALCGMEYGEVDAYARKFLALPDSPLDLEGSVWTLRSSKDAFILLGSLVGTASQQRFRDACIRVFGEIDRTLDIPDDKKPIVPIRGADFQHSEWLRRGLSTTLLLISGLHGPARFKTIDESPERFVDRVVAALPRLTADVKLLASLKSEFPKLVEASPHPLASALEHVLEGDGEEWAPIIFRDKKGQHFLNSTSPHTYILWALETLAWNPNYLHRAASILMTLAQFDPGGATINRPLNSLRDIFLAWRPNTYAGVEERIAVLRKICRARPQVGMELAMALLPARFDHSGGTAKPRLRDFGDAQSRVTTRADMQMAYRGYETVALELAGTDIHQITTLVERLPQLGPSARESLAIAIRAAAGNSTADDIFALWSKLRRLIGTHRQFQSADWAMKDKELISWDALCDELAPRDTMRRIVWLFDDVVPEIVPPEEQDFIGRANRAREAAISELMRENGWSAALDLAKLAKRPYLVGFAMAQSVQSREILGHAFDAALATGSGVAEDFVLAMSAAAHERFGGGWDEWIRGRVKPLQAEQAAKLFMRWSDTVETWTFVATLGEEIDREYWKRKVAFRQSSDDDLFFALGKFIAVGRFGACLDMLAYQENRVPAAVCIGILQGLVRDSKGEAWSRQRYSVLHMIQALQRRDDVDLSDLAAIEYQFLPLLEFQGEPVALHRLISSSPKFFVDVVSDVFFPASGDRPEITEDRRLRARFGYQLLRSIKSLPGFTPEAQDISLLKKWIVEVQRGRSDRDYRRTNRPDSCLRPGRSGG
jgi:hypothetical protein